MNKTVKIEGGNSKKLSGLPAGKTTSSKSQHIVRKNKKVLETVEQKSGILQRITQLVESIGSRELQVLSYSALLQSLKRGDTSGIFKLPTGTGKTRIFANILKAFQKNGLILVPRTDLYGSTARELQAVGFSSQNIHLVHEETGNNSEARMMSLLTNPNIDWSSGKNVCIMTYQALTQMVRKNPEMGVFMKSHFDVVIEDEAHRGLGDKTKGATESITAVNSDQLDGTTDGIDEQVDVSLEKEADEILRGVTYNYKFTATPDLIGKSVSDDGGYVMYATVEQGIRTGAIVLPQYIGMGEAFIRDKDLDKWKIGDIEQMAENDQFIDSEGVSMRDKIITTYLEKKNKHGSLPGVAFASTIKHAEQIVKHMRKLGIRAERVTSDPSDIASETATEMMDNGELDVIVTVTKVSEGFDYPPLACAMWFAPVLSNAKILQGNGRIMRTTDKKETGITVDADARLIASQSTYIIAPSVWYGGSVGASSTGGNGGKKGGDKNTPQRKSSLPRVGNFYELLMRQGELDINSLPQEIRDIIKVNESIVCEVGEELEIDSVKYIGFTRISQYNGLKGDTIITNAQNKIPGEIQTGRNHSGFIVHLIPLAFIKEYEIIPVVDLGQDILIDGVKYTGISRKNIDILGCDIGTLTRNARERGIILKKGKQTNGYSITLVPNTLIEEMKLKIDSTYAAQFGEKIEINNQIYIGISSTGGEYFGLTGFTIINSAKRSGVTIYEGWQKGGNYTKKPIQLIPKEFIDSLLSIPVCNIGDVIMIDGIDYMGITYNSRIGELGGQNIIASFRRNYGNVVISGRQSEGPAKGKPIQLIPKSFIESLKKSQ